jgi:hypothetical protein
MSSVPAGPAILTSFAIARSNSASRSAMRSAWAAAWFATGHYARLVRDAAPVELHKAKDRRQGPELLPARRRPRAARRTLMPLGSLEKTRCASARAAPACRSSTSPTAPASASSASAHFASFCCASCRALPAPSRRPIMSSSRHPRGTGLSTRLDSAPALRSAAGVAPAAPWYVAAKDAERNALVVVQGHDHPLLSSGALTTKPLHWLTTPAASRSCTRKGALPPGDQAALLEPRPRRHARSCCSINRSARLRPDSTRWPTRASAASAEASSNNGCTPLSRLVRSRLRHARGGRRISTLPRIIRGFQRRYE